MVLRFGDHVLDIERRELRRGAEPVALEPQVFDLLVYLVRNRDRVVSKDDLIEGVWGGRIVSDSALTSRLNAARKAVDDSGAEQRVIRTVQRRGVRFIGEVSEDSEPAAEVVAAPAAAEAADRTAPVDRRAALCQFEQRPRTAIFCRRGHRGSDDRSVADPGHAGDLAQYRLYLSGQAGRHKADRPRAWCALCARRRGPAGGKPSPRHRPADRCRNRRTSVGRAVRRRRRRSVRLARRDHATGSRLRSTSNWSTPQLPGRPSVRTRAITFCADVPHG